MTAETFEIDDFAKKLRVPLARELGLGDDEVRLEHGHLRATFITPEHRIILTSQGDLALVSINVFATGVVFSLGTPNWVQPFLAGRCAEFAQMLVAKLEEAHATR